MFDEATTANILRQFEALPDRLGGHIALSLAALAVGTLVSIPLGVWSSRRPRFEHAAMAVASVIQTIPSLALLAIMVIFTGIGWLPAVIALILYSILPTLRNTITGIQGVDPACIEAAQGIGMTDRQMLYSVQLPLAMPTILAGVRTASVWVVGLATIAQPIGATSLGNYIFTGLQTSNYVAVFFGCVFSALLALALDGLFLALERAARHRSLKAAILVCVGLAAIAISPVILGLMRPRAHTSGRPIVIGCKPISEQYILTEVIRNRLQAENLSTDDAPGLGSTVLFEAMRRGDVDCYVDYTGTVLATIMKRESTGSSEEIRNAVSDYLKQKHNIHCLGPLGFDNSYVFAMRRTRAEELGIRTIGDLARHAGEMRAGADIEFFERPEWRSVEKAYGLQFAKEVTMDATLMYGAIAGDKLDVIAAYNTDGRIAANDLVVLEDPRKALPPYDAILLVTKRVAQDPAAVAALEPLIGAISTESMRRANMMVDQEGQTPAAAAQTLVKDLLEPAVSEDNK